MAIIGISGVIGSGKNTVANIIADEILRDQGYKIISFAARLKDCVSALFQWDRSLLEGDTEQSRAFRNVPDPFWSMKLGTAFTPRLALQHTGEKLKQVFGTNFWVNIVESELQQNPDQNYIIPDIRYPGEIDLVERYGGHLIEVQRGKNPAWYDTAYLWNIGVIKGSMPEILTEIPPSEWSWIGVGDKHIVHNNGTIESLKRNVELCLVHCGVLDGD